MDSAVSSLTNAFTTPKSSPRDKKKEISPLTPNTPDKGEIIIPYVAPPPPRYPPPPTQPAPQLMRPMPQTTRLMSQYQPPSSAPQPPIGKAPVNSRPYKEPYKGGKTRKRKIKKRKTKKRKRRKSIKNKKR